MIRTKQQKLTADLQAGWQNVSILKSLARPHSYVNSGFWALGAIMS